MPIVYKSCGTGDGKLEHFCDPCAESEFGRVRGAAFIKKSYMTFDEDGNIDKAKIETEEFWTTGIESGDIIVVPKTSGTYDGGTPKTGKGYGDVKEKTLGKDFIVSLTDPNHTQNEEFWNSMEKAADGYYLAFRTATELRVSEKPISSVTAKDNVEEDTDTEVVWVAEIKWFQARGTVRIFSMAALKNVFECFEVTPTNPGA